MADILFCPSCGIYQSRSLSDLMSHIRLIHADEPNFRIDCTLQGCCRTFKNFHTYRNHIYAFHSTSTGSLPQQVTVSVADDDDDNDVGEDQLEPDTPLQSCEVAVPLQRSAAIWTLKVRDVYSLPQSTTEQILKDVDSLYKVHKFCQHENVTEL